jgi:hypothetical protein
VYWYTEADGDVDFDDLAVIPAVNGLAAIGHNWRPCLDVTLRSSDDGFVADDVEEATLTLARPSCRVLLDEPVYREWWRVRLGGTNTEIPSVDELWLGYAQALSKAELPEARVVRLPMCVAPADLSSSYRDRISDDPTHRLELDFIRWSEAPYRELMHEIDRRTYGGHGPLIVFPVTVADEIPVLYGRPDPAELALVREIPIWRQSLTVHGMAVTARST